MPSTLRGELDRLGYDWESGQMIQQDGVGLQTVTNCRAIQSTDPVLDQRFANGTGFLDLPRFMAADSLAIYVPYRDNQGSGLRRIYHEPAEYMERGEIIPYPEV